MPTPYEPLSPAQIATAGPGPEFDALIGRAAGMKPCRTRWQIVHNDGMGVAYRSEWAGECEAFLAGQQAQGQLLDYHVATVEEWPCFSTDLGCAALLLTRTRWYEMAMRPTGAVANCTGTPAGKHCASFEEMIAYDRNLAGWISASEFVPSLRDACQALALCRAWLASLPYQPAEYVTEAHERALLRQYRQQLEEQEAANG